MLTNEELTARMNTYADALMAESLEYEKARNRQAILRSRLNTDKVDNHKTIEDIRKIDTKIQKHLCFYLKLYMKLQLNSLNMKKKFLY